MKKILLQGREAYPKITGNPRILELNLYDLGIREIDKSYYDMKQHKHVKSLFTPVKMLVREIDWDIIRKECGVTKNVFYCADW